MPALTQDQKLEGVRALLNPRNVAIVGASDRPGNWSLRVFQTLRRFDFPGPDLSGQSAQQDRVGRRDLLSVALPTCRRTPDHVVVIVPGAAAIDTIAEAGKVKARSATVFSGGFGEGGDPKGRELAVRAQAPRSTAPGIAVSGPNCLGNLAAPHRFMTIPDDRIAELERGPVAIVGQSGGIVMAIQRALARARRQDQLRDHHRQRDRALYVGLHPLSRRRSACEGDRLLHRVRSGMRPNSGAPASMRATPASPWSRSRSAAPRRAASAALAHTGSLAGSLQCFDAVAETVGVDPRRHARRGGRGRGIFLARADRRKGRGSAA